MEILIRRGDITEQPDVEAIVNAANTDLILGAGVAGAIRRKGGDVIDREGRAKAPIRLGEAVATTAGRLPNTYVIHAAAMGYRDEDAHVPKRGGSLTSGEIIAAATQSCLRVADELKLHAVAFPALGTGVAGFPTDECAQVMIQAARRYSQDHPRSCVEKVIFVLFDEGSFEVFQNAASSIR
ncbi:MAG: macro domain-containing protein [Acidobacteriia bacterium]|nr:macro domain-containing protein [Terriglobia bacterium]